MFQTSHWLNRSQYQPSPPGPYTSKSYQQRRTHLNRVSPCSALGVSRIYISLASYGPPPFLAGLGAKLSGIVGQILPFCEKLRTLRCQDPDFDIQVIGVVGTLQTLHATLADTEPLDQCLEAGLKSLQYINIEVYNSYANFDRFDKKWNGRAGLTVQREDTMPIHKCPMIEFRSGLPDPLWMS